MTEVTLIIAFAAGLVSFLSPCVLPIVPGFLAYLAGASLSSQKSRQEGEHGEVQTFGRLPIFLNSLFFVVGFSTVFALLGVLLSTILESITYEAQEWLARIGGTIVIVFGFYLTGLVRISFLERPYTFRITKRFNSRYMTSFAFGAAFAAGWTPCVGAALGAILGLAATAPGTAFQLLFAYSLGLGLPFLAVGLFATQATGLIQRYRTVTCYLARVFGVVLVVLGVLVFTQSLSLIANLSFINNFLLQ